MDSVDLDLARGISLIEQTSSDGTEKTVISVSVICKNHGKTPGWITMRRFGFLLAALPPKSKLSVPEKGNNELELLASGAESKYTGDVETVGRREQGKSAIIYGVVEYRDIFGFHRKTNFGYHLVQGNKLQRLTELTAFDTKNA